MTHPRLDFEEHVLSSDVGLGFDLAARALSSATMTGSIRITGIRAAPLSSVRKEGRGARNTYMPELPPEITWYPSSGRSRLMLSKLALRRTNQLGEIEICARTDAIEGNLEIPRRLKQFQRFIRPVAQSMTKEADHSSGR